MTKSLHAPQSSKLSEKFEEKQSAEPPRSVDDSTLKSRSKRESRRQRELEQATFSLELLKVRSGSVSKSEPVSKHLPSSPQASTDSQESFEELAQVSMQMSENSAKLEKELEQVSKPEPMEENQTSPASFKPHFYIADDEGSPAKSSPSRSEKKESVLVIISMQKENPVDLEPEHDQQMAAEDRQQEFLLSDDHPHAHSTPEPQTHHGLVTSSSSKALQLDSREAAVTKKDVQKKFVSQSISISMTEKADLAVSPKRSRLTFSK